MTSPRSIHVACTFCTQHFRFLFLQHSIYIYLVLNTKIFRDFNTNKPHIKDKNNNKHAINITKNNTLGLFYFLEITK